MTTDLVSWVYAHLDDSDLDDETKYVVIAALEGTAELDAYLADGTSPVERAPVATEPEAEDAAERS